METLIIKAIYKGDHSMFEKGKEYSIIVTKIENSWIIPCLKKAKNILL